MSWSLDGRREARGIERGVEHLAHRQSRLATRAGQCVEPCGQVDHLGVTGCGEHTPDLGTIGGLEVGLGEEQVLTGHEAGEARVSGEAQHGQGDDERRERVDVRPPIGVGSVHVLVVGVPVLIGWSDTHAGDPDAVEIDELELVVVGEQDVAVLVVAVGELLVLEGLDEIEPAVGEAGQATRIAEAILDRDVQRIARDPRHDDDGPPLSVHPHTLVEPCRRHDGRHVEGVDMLLERPVPQPTVVMGTQQTPHGDRALGGLHVERDGVLTAGGGRDPERCQRQLPLLELGVGERGRRLLDRRGVFGSGGPATRRSWCARLVHCHHRSFDVVGSAGGAETWSSRRTGGPDGGCDGGPDASEPDGASLRSGRSAVMSSRSS